MFWVKLFLDFLYSSLRGCTESRDDGNMLGDYDKMDLNNPNDSQIQEGGAPRPERKIQFGTGDEDN